MIRVRLIALGLLASSGIATAGIDGAGTTGASFLATGTGPAVLGMAGATLGSGQGLAASAWNPAALAWLGESQVALSHAALDEAQNQEWLAFGGRMGGTTRWGFTALYQGEGGFAGRNASNEATGDFGVSSSAFGASVARAITPRLAVGLGARYLREDLAGVSGSGFGFDAGLQASLGAFGFGAAARNVGGSVRYDGTRWDLPANVGFGVAWADAASGLRATVDANFPSAYYNDVRAGLEWRLRDRIALRGGYRMDLGAGPDDRLAGPTFGFGTGANGLWLDYAFLTGSNGAPASHRMGLTLRPGQWMNLRPALAANAGDEIEPRPGTRPAPGTGKRSAAPAPAPAKKPAAKGEPAASALEAPAPPVVTKAAPAARRTTSAPGEPAPSVKETPAGKPWTVPLDASTASEARAARSKAPAAKSLVAGSPAAKVAQAALPAEGVAVQPIAPAAVAQPVAAPASPAAAPQVVKPVAEPAKSVPAPAEDKAKARPAKRPATITVKNGQTLPDIAEQWETSVAAIMMENNLVREQIRPGMTLRLPPAGRR